MGAVGAGVSADGVGAVLPVQGVVPVAAADAVMVVVAVQGVVALVCADGVVAVTTAPRPTPHWSRSDPMHWSRSDPIRSSPSPPDTPRAPEEMARSGVRWVVPVAGTREDLDIGRMDASYTHHVPQPRSRAATTVREHKRRPAGSSPLRPTDHHGPGASPSGHLSAGAVPRGGRDGPGPDLAGRVLDKGLLEHPDVD